jgi:hypothetical protein
MSHKHGPRRAEVVFTEVAEAQVAKFDVAELIAADRAIVAIQTNSWIGDLKENRVPVREYREPDTGVRVVYTTTVLGTIVIIAYIEA